MAEKVNSLTHTKWMCKYHIVFTPKYRRNAIYNQYVKKCEQAICLRNTNICDTNQCQYNLWNNWLSHKTV